ncbi:hypothetical protein C8F01DRAFT_1317979 [Mycena amicta]|nr:hypothetical protein C8F01DRAFT_1317979 [Mycena amicta]
MTTPHRPQASSAVATRSGWMKRLMPSQTASAPPSGSPSDSAADTATPWLDGLLLVARLGVGVTESAPPAAKAVFESVVLFLEKVEKVQKNQQALQDICEKTVSTLEVLRSVIQDHPEVASTAHLQEKCRDFEQLLNGISITIEEIKKKQTSWRLGKKFNLPSDVTSAIAVYVRNITDLQEKLKLLAVRKIKKKQTSWRLGKKFNLPSDVTSAIAVYVRNITDLQEKLKLLAVRSTELVLNETPGAQIPPTDSSEFLAAHTTTGTSWFEATFNPQLGRSQIEDALAGNITDVIQDIWNYLTNPIRATLNYTENPLEKVRALLNHLDTQFGNLVLIRSF